MHEFCTIGDLARRWGLPAWAVRRAADRELQDPPCRAGGYRLLNPDEVNRVERALQLAGKLVTNTTPPTDTELIQANHISK